MKTKSQKVSLAFRNKGDSGILDTAYGVSANLYSEAAFATPSVEKATLDAAITDMEAAKAAMVQGGTAATAERDEKREALYALLKKLASYVNVTADNDLAILLSSGFEAASTNRTSEQLPPPAYVTAKNGLTGQALLSVKPVKNSRGYEPQYSLVDETTGSSGQWESATFATGSRNIPINNLVPGKLYIFRVRALGGLTGQSNWSEAVSHRAN